MSLIREPKVTEVGDKTKIRTKTKRGKELWNKLKSKTKAVGNFLKKNTRKTRKKMGELIKTNPNTPPNQVQLRL